MNLAPCFLSQHSIKYSVYVLYPRITQFSSRGFRSEQMWHLCPQSLSWVKKKTPFYRKELEEMNQVMKVIFLSCVAGCFGGLESSLPSVFSLPWAAAAVKSPFAQRVCHTKHIQSKNRLAAFSISRKVVWITFPFSLSELVILLLQSGFAALNEVGTSIYSICPLAALFPSQ